MCGVGGLVYLSDSFIHDWKQYLSYRFFLGVLCRWRGKSVATQVFLFLDSLLMRNTVFTAVFKDKSTEIKKSTWQRLHPVNSPSSCKVNYRFQSLK